VPDTGAGGIRGYFALIEDISRPKAAEDALRAREEEARTLLSSLPDVISRFDGNLRFLYTSPAMQRETGLPCEHFIGKTHASAGLPLELAERLEAKLRDIFETGQTRYVEFDLTIAERGVRNYFGIGVPEFGREGCVQAVLTITRDITERKQAEEKLQASEELFRRIVATAAEGIWIVDAETNTTFVNERMAEMLGYGASELIGRSCFEFIHPDDAARGREGFERRKLGDTAPREYRAYRRDGTVRWMNFTASPMKDDRGNLIGILAM
jgi:PAS domain S-box-containing protein